jgi:hypothetical protein
MLVVTDLFETANTCWPSQAFFGYCPSEPWSMKTHIVCSGMPLSGATQLWRVLRENLIGTFHRPDELVRATAAKSSEHVLTSHPKDVLRLDAVIATSIAQIKRLRILLLVRDPREIFAERHGKALHQGQVGLDYSLSMRSSDRVNYNEPGLLHYARAISRAQSNEEIEQLTIRYEDLRDNPARERIRIEAFLGFQVGEGFDRIAGLGRRRAQQASAAWQSPRDAAAVVRAFRRAPELFGYLRTWGYESDEHWYEALSASASAGLDDTPGTVVAFFTEGSPGEAEARRLEASVRALDLPVALIRVPDQGSALANRRAKAGLLAEARRSLKGPLFNVDVAAVFHSDPWPVLRGYDQDAALCTKRDGQVCSTTLLLNDGAGAHRFLARWQGALDVAPEAEHETLLFNLLTESRVSVEPVFTIGLLPAFLAVESDRPTKLLADPPPVPVVEYQRTSGEAASEAGDGSLNRLVSLGSREAAERQEGGLLEGVFAKITPTQRQERTKRLQEGRLTDVARWSDPGNLKQVWSLRAERVAQLIGTGAQVLDIGCGAMDLERHLPEGCVYIPADLVARDARTLLCNLNEGCLPDRPADVITMLGVIEYCHDPQRVFKMLSELSKRLIVTYNPVDLDDGRDRSRQGWFNALTSAALVSLAEQAHYELQVVAPASQRERIYLFERLA